MTHGSEDTLEAYDGTFKLRQVLKVLTSGYSPTLKEKPIILLIQSCRGRNYDFVETDHAYERTTETAKIDAKPFCPFEIPDLLHHSNLLILRSTQHGFVSFRDFDGSPFIKAILNHIKSLTESGIKIEIHEMFEKIINDVKKEIRFYDGRWCRQTPSLESRLEKKFLLGKKDYGKSKEIAQGTPLSLERAEDIPYHGNRLDAAVGLSTLEQRSLGI